MDASVKIVLVGYTHSNDYTAVPMTATSATKSSIMEHTEKHWNLTSLLQQGEFWKNHPLYFLKHVKKSGGTYPSREINKYSICDLADVEEELSAIYVNIYNLIVILREMATCSSISTRIENSHICIIDGSPYSLAFELVLLINSSIFAGRFLQHLIVCESGLDLTATDISAAAVYLSEGTSRRTIQYQTETIPFHKQFVSIRAYET